MPIYEYECRECGHVFDALQKISDDPLRDCPDCGRPELRKLLSAPNFRLKGGGWYETDFKDSNRRNLAADGKDKVNGSDSGTGSAKSDQAADSTAGSSDKPKAKPVDKSAD